MEKFCLNPNIEPELSLSQPLHGYRFSTDPLILAALVDLEGIKTVLDVGCGCGIISILLARRSTMLKICGIEIQEELVFHAKKNVLDHGLKHQVQIMAADINRIEPKDIGGPVDLIVSNPPYKKKGTGRLNPDRQKAVARHELYLSLDQLFNAADHLLKPSGKINVIIPADRLADLEYAAQRHRFNLYSIQKVITKKDTSAKRVVISASRGLQKRPSAESYVDIC